MEKERKTQTRKTRNTKNIELKLEKRKSNRIEMIVNRINNLTNNF